MKKSIAVIVFALQIVLSCTVKGPDKLELQVIDEQLRDLDSLAILDKDTAYSDILFGFSKEKLIEISKNTYEIGHALYSVDVDSCVFINNELVKLCFVSKDTFDRSSFDYAHDKGTDYEDSNWPYRFMIQADSEFKERYGSRFSCEHGRDLIVRTLKHKTITLYYEDVDKKITGRYVKFKSLIRIEFQKETRSAEEALKMWRRDI